MKEILVSESELSHMMYRRGIRPSLQRLAVLSYIANTRLHPTADDIFTELVQNYPSLSRTTVYNSLHSLVEAGIVKEVEIESGVRHYDFALQQPHSHFICRVCGNIIDMEMPSGVRDVNSSEFDIEDVEVVFKGLCPVCKKAQSAVGQK